MTNHHPSATACWVLALGVLGLCLADHAMAFKLEPEARLHLDYAAHDADAEPLDDGDIVRRAIIGLKGKAGEDWTFEAAYELADKGRLRPGDGKFKDVALSYEGWRVGDFTLGQIKLPFSLEELTSSNDSLFIERALPVDAFAPSRRLGLGFRHQRAAYTVSAMAFGSSIDGDDRGRGLGARATWVPAQCSTSVLHLGAAVVVERPRSKVDFDTTPESRVADEDLVNTGGVEDVRRIDRLGLEAAWRSGPLTVQTEWLQAWLRRDAGAPGARLNGGYLAASWLLSGEVRPYKNGRFKGISPSRSTGAWELTARLSHIDLDDAGVRGGHERNLTFGLNYHFNEHMRVMFNYIRVHSQRRGQTDDPHLLLLRLQLAL